MNPVTTDQLRSNYLRFFADRGHAILASASLLPDGDPSVLFTTAGMHPLVPYLRGRPHPAGTRLANCQKCLRTGDIESVGDDTHLTLFEMLGNWSLGDYDKHQSIFWSFEFLTAPEHLGIPRERLWVTVFEGDASAPRDEAARSTWIGLGIPDAHIVFLGADDNFWAAGPEGPCGPDTEIFYDTTGIACGYSARCAPGLCSCGRFVEIWNNVFMSYERRDGRVEPLARHNIDTGMGLERTVAVLSGASSVFEVDGLREITARLSAAAPGALSPERTRALRVCTDHLRTAVFVLADPRAPEPSNQGAGYVLRRIIRRAIRYCRVLGLSPSAWRATADTVVEHYGDCYPELREHRTRVASALEHECERFERTLDRGSSALREVIGELRSRGETELGGETAFRLFDTFGFPLELTVELAQESGIAVDTDGFAHRFEEHRERSRSSAAKSGLADDSPESIRYHTTTHLLHAALRDVLGSQVEQRGSNITRERLRFDFNFERPLSAEEKRRVEDFVQAAIDRELDVTCEILPIGEAKRRGALGLFDARYGHEVSVYRIGDVSLEICAGPHVADTGELGRFEIAKEQSCGAGTRRIRAVLHPRGSASLSNA